MWHHFFLISKPIVKNSQKKNTYRGLYRTPMRFFFRFTNPRSLHFKICNSDFHRQNLSCSILKLATRIFTSKIRVPCISKFQLEFLPQKSELYLSRNKQRGFLQQTLKLCYFQICNSDFRSKNWCFVISKFTTWTKLL